jgi:predicted O-linked N-acetylglucosamine transferase (SPINDLY family)
VSTLFEAVGITRDRIELVASVPRLEYFRRFHALDLSLDPFPYNGHTSTLDSLWMGVPVITLAGRTAVGRGGVSLLSNVGLPEFIADTPERYVALAVHWASDWPQLSQLRSGLRARMEASPLTDGARFAADVKAALRQMWRNWCSQ